jgi:predicted transcriptional regulator
MTDKTKIRIVVDEDAAIVERLDAIAAAESISRADVLRRAIRRLVFSMPTVPTFENISVDESDSVAA